MVSPWCWSRLPAESTAYRFAKLDLKSWPEAASVVKGDPGTGEVYYTNSSHIPYSVRMDPADKSSGRSFHPMISAGAITHLWGWGSTSRIPTLSRPSYGKCSSTRRTPRWLSVRIHHMQRLRPVSRGAPDGVRLVRSGDVDGITRITGYFTRTSSWNGGKRAELQDRVRSSCSRPVCGNDFHNS